MRISCTRLTAAAPGRTPHRPWPTSISMKTSITAGAAAAAARFVHRLGEAVDAFGTVHRNGQLTLLRCHPVRQRRHAGQLVRRDHLVADVDVVDAAVHHGLRLRPVFCTQQPTAPAWICSCASAALLCILACRSPPDVVLAAEIGHAGDVASHRIEIDRPGPVCQWRDALAHQPGQAFSQVRFRRGLHCPDAGCRTIRPA